MTAQGDPYVRVYYSVVDDDKFEGVWEDKEALGWWLTLLIECDAMYPAHAALPRDVPDRVVDLLVARRIIEVHRGRAAMVGLKPERERRSESARNAANVRHHPPDATALRPHSERIATAHAPSEAAAAPAVPPDMRTHALRSAPLLSEPNRSVAHVPAREATTDQKIKGTLFSPKPPPEDEELVGRYLAKYHDPATSPEVRSAVRAQLSFMGVDADAQPVVA